MTTQDWQSPDFGIKQAFGFTIESIDGESVTRLELADFHMNPNGVAHGAVPFTLMDTAMGGAVMSTVAEGQRCATIEMQTRFHRPVATGSLTATARVTTAGRRVIHLAAETRDDDDRLVASATASFAVFEA